MRNGRHCHRKSPAPFRFVTRFCSATCTLLFVLRVLGQAVVGLGDVGFLPPFERWYSGLLPYSLLLPAQIILIALMLKIVGDFARARWLLRPSADRARASS